MASAVVQVKKHSRIVVQGHGWYRSMAMSTQFACVAPGYNGRVNV